MASSHKRIKQQETEKRQKKQDKKQKQEELHEQFQQKVDERVVVRREKQPETGKNESWQKNEYKINRD